MGVTKNFLLMAPFLCRKDKKEIQALELNIIISATTRTKLKPERIIFKEVENNPFSTNVLMGRSIKTCPWTQFVNLFFHYSSNSWHRIINWYELENGKGLCCYSMRTESFVVETTLFLPNQIPQLIIGGRFLNFIGFIESHQEIHAPEKDSPSHSRSTKRKFQT